MMTLKEIKPDDPGYYKPLDELIEDLAHAEPAQRYGDVILMVEDLTDALHYLKEYQLAQNLAELGKSEMDELIHALKKVRGEDMSYHKYNAQKTEVNGIVFSSKLEATRFEQLLLLEKAGEISNLTLQPQFQIWIGRKDSRTGERYPSRYYVGDFMYIDRDEHKVIVEDTKGQETPVFRQKWDLVRSLYPEYEFRKLTREDV